MNNISMPHYTEGRLIQAAYIREDDQVWTDPPSPGRWRTVVGREQHGTDGLILHFDDGPDESWELAYKHAEWVWVISQPSMEEMAMPETPRTWTLGWNPQGGYLTISGPSLANPDDVPHGGLKVYEAAPVDAERERMLDLLERHLPMDGKPRCAADRETINLLRASRSGVGHRK